MFQNVFCLDNPSQHMTKHMYHLKEQGRAFGNTLIWNTDSVGTPLYYLRWCYT
jgi:hypothetical protein